MVTFILFFVFLSISHRALRNFIQIQPFFGKSFRKYFCRNINIYVKINFQLLHLSRYDYCIYACAHKGVFIIPSLMPVNVIQHRWVVGNFNSHFNFHKSKLDSLLGICPLLKKIVHVLIFYILSHVVSGFSNISGWPFNW